MLKTSNSNGKSSLIIKLFISIFPVFLISMVYTNISPTLTELLFEILLIVKLGLYTLILFSLLVEFPLKLFLDTI